MKRFALVLLMLGLSSVAFGDDTWVKPETDPEVTPDKPVVMTEADHLLTAEPQAKRMSWREKRRLGVTRANIIRVGVKLHKEGKLDLEDRDMMMNQIMAEITAQNPQAYADPTAMDWGSIFAFLEKILPLLISIFSMFS